MSSDDRRKGQEKKEVVGVPFGSEQRTGSSGVNWCKCHEVRLDAGTQTQEGSWEQGSGSEDAVAVGTAPGGVGLQQGGVLLRARHFTSGQGWGQILRVAAWGPGSPRKCQLQALGPGWAVQEVGTTESCSAKSRANRTKKKQVPGGEMRTVRPGWCAFLSTAAYERRKMPGPGAPRGPAGFLEGLGLPGISGR